MAWLGSFDENFRLLNASMLEEQKEYDWNCSSCDDSLFGNQWCFSSLSALDAFDGTLEALLGPSIAPLSSTVNNTNEMTNDSDCLYSSPVGAVKRLESLEDSPCFHGGEPISLQRWKTAEAKSELDGSNERNCAYDENEKNQSEFGKVGVGRANNNPVSFGMEVSDNKRQKNRNGLPAKNLMAERRRRKKLNDRLHMLRSVVPKISKTDRASTLGDTIEYLKELLQRINELHNELMQSSKTPCQPGNSLKFQPLTHIYPALLCGGKEENHLAVPNPDGQPAKVDVRTREGKVLNIHMFCSIKPGLLLSVMRALDGLGLDVKEAVTSCSNGFTLDVFQAESMERDISAEDIQALLLHTAVYQPAL